LLFICCSNIAESSTHENIDARYSNFTDIHGNQNNITYCNSPDMNPSKSNNPEDHQNFATSCNIPNIGSSSKPKPAADTSNSVVINVSGDQNVTTYVNQTVEVHRVRGVRGYHAGDVDTVGVESEVCGHVVIEMGRITPTSDTSESDMVLC
jgi:hypothetical protein